MKMDKKNKNIIEKFFEFLSQILYAISFYADEIKKKIFGEKENTKTGSVKKSQRDGKRNAQPSAASKDTRSRSNDPRQETERRVQSKTTSSSSRNEQGRTVRQVDIQDILEAIEEEQRLQSKKQNISNIYDVNQGKKDDAKSHITDISLDEIRKRREAEQKKREDEVRRYENRIKREQRKTETIQKQEAPKIEVQKREEKKEEERKRPESIWLQKQLKSLEELKKKRAQEKKEKASVEPAREEKEKPIIEPVREEKEKPIIEPVREEKEKPIIEPVREEKKKPSIEPVREEKEKPSIEPVRKTPDVDKTAVIRKNTAQNEKLEELKRMQEEQLAFVQKKQQEQRELEEQKRQQEQRQREIEAQKKQYEELRKRQQEQNRQQAEERRKKEEEQLERRLKKQQDLKQLQEKEWEEIEALKREKEAAELELLRVSQHEKEQLEILKEKQEEKEKLEKLKREQEERKKEERQEKASDTAAFSLGEKKEGKQPKSEKRQSKQYKSEKRESKQLKGETKKKSQLKEKTKKEEAPKKKDFGWVRSGAVAAIVVMALMMGGSFIGKKVSGNTEKNLTQKTTQQEQVAAPEESSVTLSFVGDILCHGPQFQDAYNVETGVYDFSNCFSQVKPYLESADLMIGNLETVFAGKEQKYTGHPTFNTPDEMATALKEAGFDILTTANNHSFDRGETGVIRTLDVLDQVGISHMGTYRNEQEKQNIVVKEVNGIKFAFVSFTTFVNQNTTNGNSHINYLTETEVNSQMQLAKAQNPDCIVAMPHWGVEYETVPNDVQKQQADLLIDAGADIIIGSHPHVVQKMGKKKTTMDGNTREVFVAYSLGNFCSNQNSEYTRDEVLLNLTVKKGANGIYIENIGYRPLYMYKSGTGINTRDFQIIDIATYRKNFTQDGDEASQNLYNTVQGAQEHIKMLLKGEAAQDENAKEIESSANDTKTTMAATTNSQVTTTATNSQVTTIPANNSVATSENTANAYAAAAR